MKSVTTSLAAAVLAAASFALATDGSTLQRTPKVGDVAKYAVTVNVDTQEGRVTINMLDTRTVTDVQSNGDYTEEANDTGGSRVMGAQKLAVPDAKITTSYHANGQAFKITGDGVDAKAYRIEALNDFYSPGKSVKPGEKWTFVSKADPTVGTRNVTMNYTVEAEEKVGTHDTYRISYTGTEDGDSPGSVSGKVWVDVASGEIVKADLALKSAPIPQADAPYDLTVSVLRQD